MIGKWADSGVPHRGWVCFHSADLGEPYLHTCQMCEHQQPRHVYHMQHDDYPAVLVVGRVCGDSMALPRTGSPERDAGRARSIPQPSPLASQLLRSLGAPRLAEIIEREGKLSVTDGLHLVTQLTTGRKPALEPLQGTLNFRGHAATEALQGASDDALSALLTSGLLTSRQARLVEAYCDSRREAAEEKKRRKAEALPARTLCTKLFRAQPGLKEFCACVAEASYGETKVSAKQVRWFFASCRRAGITVDEQARSQILQGVRVRWRVPSNLNAQVADQYQCGVPLADIAAHLGMRGRTEDVEQACIYALLLRGLDGFPARM